MKKIRFQPLEPRILLDAAAVATVADTTADLDQQNELHNLIQTAIVRDPQTEVRNNNPESANTAAGTFQLEVRPVATDGEPVTLSAEIESSALVVIDTSIHGYEDLLADLEPDTDILLIDRNENGLQKLADYVEGRDDISSIHILSHGAEGEFTLGSVTINADNIDQHAELLGQIGESLTENGDLLLYGCNVADDGTSIEFVNKVANYTEADVAVSTNLTGAAALGGDWDLEHTIGQIDGASLDLTSFQGLLADPVAVDDTATTDEDTPLTTTATTNLLDNDSDPDGDSLSITQVRSTTDSASTTLQPNDVVQSMISPAGDVDYWQFTLTESGVVTLETSGSTDTLGLLLNGIGVPLVEDDDSGASLNFQIQETLPAGTYYIRVTGYTGDVGDYTLSLDFEPDPEANFEPDSEASNIRPNDEVPAMISPAGDVDYWQFTLTESGVVTLETSGSTDTVGRLLNAIGTFLAFDDDSGAGINFRIQGTLPAGTYYIRVAGYASGSIGDYTLSLDFEPDSEANIGRATAGSNGGQFTINADGTWSFNPGTDFEDLSADATRATSITYTVSDGNGGTATATLMVTVTGVNDAPEANDDEGLTHKDGVLTVPDGADGSTTDDYNADLLLNDIDPNGDALSIAEVDGDTVNLGRATEGTNGGQFTINADGSWSFDPGTDFAELRYDETRSTRVNYTVSDGNGGTDTADLWVTVTGVNDGSIAIDDSGQTAEDRVLTVADGAIGTTTTDEDGDGTTINADLLLNDYDLQDDALSITEVGGDPANLGGTTEGTNGGKFIINADGSWSFDPDNSFNHLGVDLTKDTSVEYTVSDGDGGTDTATLTVIVSGVNTAPVAVDDSGRASKDRVLTVPGDLEDGSGLSTNNDLLHNDFDLDSFGGSITQVAGITANVGEATAGSNGGEFTINADGTYRFDPGTDFDDLASSDTRTTSVTYTLSDNHGATDTATLTVTVGDFLITTNDLGITGEDSVLTVANDAAGTANVDGFTYRDAAGFLSYTDAEAFTYNSGLLLNDIVPQGGTLSITRVDGDPDNLGRATPGVNGGEFTINADGSWRFDPGTDFQSLVQGSLRLTHLLYTVSDGNGDTATAALFVWVEGANDVATDDTGTTDEDSVLTVADGATGTTTTNEDGTTMTVNADLLLNDVHPQGDSLSIYTSGTVPGSNGGEFTVNADGSWRFDPDGDFDDLAVGATRDTSVAYRVADGDGGTERATLTVRVSGVNDAPTATDDSGRTLNDRALTVPNDARGLVNADLLYNDIDPDSNLSITAVDGDTANLGTAIAGSYGGQFTVNADGSWHFDPVTDFDDLAPGETIATSVVYTVSDGSSETASASLLVVVRGGANLVPTAVDDSGRAYGDGQSFGNRDLLLNDSDPDGDTLGITAVGSAADNVANANVGEATAGSNGGEFTIRADGLWGFDPGTDFDALVPGETRDTSVAYTISDGYGGTATATLTVTVNDASSAPDIGITYSDSVLMVPDGVRGGGSVSVSYDASTVVVNVDLLPNDVDGNASIVEVGFFGSGVGSAIEGVGGGEFTIWADGSYRFDPGTDFDDLAPGQQRIVWVLYYVSDGNGDTRYRTLVGWVVGAGDVAIDDSGRTAEDRMLTVADGATGTITTNQNGSTTRVNADLLLNDYYYPDRSLSIYRGGALSITEVDGDPANLGRATEGTDGGQFTINDDGSWSFDPDNSFNNLTVGLTKDTSVDYTVSDANGRTGTATLTVTVSGVNTAPVAVDDSGRTPQNEVLTVSTRDRVDSGLSTNYYLLYNDFDIDRLGYHLSITQVAGITANVGEATEGSNGGEFTINADGTYRFDPGTDFDDLAPSDTRTTSVEYTLSDTDGVTDTATLTVTVGDLLITTNDLGRTGEDSALTVANDATGTTNADGFTENAGLLINDLVPQGGTLSITEVDGDPDNLGRATVGSHGGEFTVNDDGSWRFDPGTDFQYLRQGNIQSTHLLYTVSDGNGDTATAALLVWVEGANDVYPTAIDDTGTTDEDSVLTVADGATGTTHEDGTTMTVNADLLLNDADRQGGTLYINEVVGRYYHTYDGTAPGNNGGWFTINSDGSWHFDPGTDFDDLAVGATRDTSVDYIVSDDDGGTERATLTVRVSGVNDAPTATDDSGRTLNDRALTVSNDARGLVNADLLYNDVDPDSNLSITAVGSATANVGRATVGSNGGQFTVNADGSWHFDPGTDFDDLAVGATRDTSVVYTVSDGSSETASASLLVVVRGGANQAPTAVDDSGTYAGYYEEGDLLYNDSDPDGNLLFITAVGSAVNNVANANVGEATAGSNGGEFTVRADGFWSFDPGADFDALVPGETRDTSVAYTISDGHGGMATATLTVTVSGLNDAPSAIRDIGATYSDSVLMVSDGARGLLSNVYNYNVSTNTVNANADLLLNDLDVDGDALSITGVWVNGITANAGEAVVGSNGGEFTIWADGSYRFDPGTDFNDLAPGVVGYTWVLYFVSDGNGGTHTGALLIWVRGAGDAPTPYPEPPLTP